MRVKVEIVRSGVNFACYAQLRDARGRVVWASDYVSHAMSHVARERAESYAASRDWKVEK